ncbi:nodulation protein NfeD [Barrientosiimonas marina]|uniref:Nodulation protein NfeD n=1 Tax=Lentibacillus kimchii TaxID=1542911 RepID=A0ABW2UZT0_9BACI
MKGTGYRQFFLIMIVSVLYALSGMLLPSFAAESGHDSEHVYVIPIKDEVEKGLEAFLSRAVDEAKENKADHIIFKIDTPGGAVNAAEQIAQNFQKVDIETTSFIANRALSAGSFLALNTDNIYMKPQATMGASGVINQDGTAADKKAQSAWLSAMKSAAESNGRDPQYAAAMADPSIDMPKYGAGEGKYLTLEASTAKEIGYSNGTVESRAELLDKLGYSDADVTEVEMTFSEHLARFITSPVVVPILLSVASIGLIVELFSPGFGIPGSIGILALILFFYGHIIAGLAGMEAVILLILGIGLIIAEFFLSGGIAGILGVASVIGSLIMSGQDLGEMVMSISIALVVTLIAAAILFKTISREKSFFNRIVLTDQTSTEHGYVATDNREELLNCTGETLTPLRPSGSALIGNERVDVVSEGGFIEKDRSISVVRVEGIRVIVREI